MSVLKRGFAFVSSFGIIGPHQGHETELLLLGYKPVGLFCLIAGEDNAEEEKSIKLLDKAVAQGHLRTHVVNIPPLDCWMGQPGIAHFYCQPGRESEMKQIAEFHDSIWNGRNAKPLPKNPGAYFGYTPADINLFESGGYASLPFFERWLMTTTHDLRRRARLKYLSMESHGPLNE